MDAQAIYLEEDRFAEHVSSALSENGLLSDEEAREMKRFLRGW